jgi:hypothetical protein
MSMRLIALHTAERKYKQNFVEEQVERKKVKKIMGG